MESNLEKCFDDFHEEIKRHCSNRVVFRKHFRVDYQHIDRKSDSEEFRLNLGDETLAAIIRGGTLNYDQSTKQGNRITLALEAKLINFEWMTLGDIENQKPPRIEEEVYVRAVVRNGKRGITVIVTAYDLFKNNINHSVKEVNHEIW